ncbi:DegT/DnrJ/EryC1/StrS family aminotransferase [Ekhidna sp.]|uniref:DegT/DnrJ/EryC1/StrS family aminotransferase n=1 Tax=Ekhidna sp. TaxID=2608089 RepID=UPI003B50B0DD
MSVPYVDLKAQYLSINDEIDSAIQECINNTAFIGGYFIEKFEQDFAKYADSMYCVGCANGTDAIEIALKVLGVGPGDEVLVPALTWISTAGAVNNVGAEPVFVDVLEQERTINPSLLEAKITNKTKAIIPVHLYGLPARMNEIMAIADRHGLKVIEDSAQAHGAEINGKKIGSFGHIATFSFYPGKNLGAYGDAGGIITNDEELARTCKMLTNHGQMVKHDHQIIGRNSRLDTMQAAILRAKLPHLESWTEKRIQHSRTYSELLANVQTPFIPDGYRHVFHVFAIQTEKRDELKVKLDESNIGNTVHYPNPLPLVPSYAYKNHSAGDFPVAEKLCREIISIPMYPEMRDDHIQAVADVINGL